MRHGSLFSGIGGFDLAAEWVGWENVFHCEWNTFGQKVLKYYWPNAESFTDITKTNFSKYENKIDILTGGFPCQPYSSAGKRRGKEDERHLWPEMLRAIREIRPRWIVGENVFGLINWSAGLVFHEVQTDLEAAGYEVQPYVLPAAAVNAPHRRDRVWFIAHAVSECYGSNKLQSIRSKDAKASGKRAQTFYNDIRSNGVEGNATYTNSNGLNKCNSENEKYTSQRGINAQCDANKVGKSNATHTKSQRFQKSEKIGKLERIRFEQSNQGNNWERFPTQSPLCSRNDGLSNKLDGITFSKWRNETIKAAGNAIVPQVALQIFKAINEYENLNLGTEETER